MSIITIRALHVDDAPHIARIFFDAVHEGTQRCYDEAQRRAWGGDAPDPKSWRKKIRDVTGFVAEENGQPVGSMTIDPGGLIDMAFVAPSASGRGIGWQLYKVVEQRARKLGATVLTTEASMVARPFFERQGWSVIEEQTVVRRGVSLTNFKMQRAL